MPQMKVLIARFPGLCIGGGEHPDTTDWYARTVIKAKADPRISDLQFWRKFDTPITMSRNMSLEIAKKSGADLVVWIDADMSPDLYLGKDKDAVPFWDVAFNFCFKHAGPCFICVPYCGPPPHENVYIFKWCNFQSDNPNPDMRIEQYTREEAAVKHGIERIAAAPTGLCMFHMDGVKKLAPPYTYYEWKDEFASEKASTEDVTFSRDLSLHAGVPLYVIWDAWSGHNKIKCVGRPVVIDADQVSEKYKQAILRGQAAKNGMRLEEQTGRPKVNGPVVGLSPEPVT